MKMQEKLKMSKRSQAGVISTILIILIVLVAIVTVWNVIQRVIKEGSDEIEVSAFLNLLKIEEIRIDKFGSAQVKIHRRSGEEEIKELKFIFRDKEGISHTLTRTENLPRESEIKNFGFIYPSYDIEEVSVTPVFKDDKLGLEVKKNPSKQEDDIYIREDGTIGDISEAGLVSWWKFDGNAEDSIGTNDGNLQNGASVNPNGELVLEGGGEYMSTSTSGVAEGTISIWVYIDSYVSSDVILGKRTSGCYSSSIFIDAGNFAVYSTGPGETIGEFSLNDWTNLVIVRSNLPTEINYYINGNLELTNSFNINLNELLANVGASCNGEKSINGKIDNGMLFNRILSQEEITAIYNNQLK